MTFPLSGLLRVRGVQERAAAESLSHARAEAVAAETAVEHAVSSLSDIATEIDDPATLLAMAAARSSGQAALADLRALAELRQDAAEAASAAHVEARCELKGLERLESAHRASELAEEQRAEQSALDEIAVVRAARDAGSAA
ncbi:flagellar FliJ family protein [Microbacterium sp. SORGH_AS_0421]|uniref:flagellar FliJ family protein n=1 Tax=Microbacterium sp. SORGH_AS_0421 TaxID=3041768 RepID=UPI0027906A05|nr:flagellar FliJ family protein [Microbacterium sp. SORGH_AS_0421]MDQ1177205.1 flagellar FliJ protein [Microbacterium sp. SORGH_AS_0421]